MVLTLDKQVLKHSSPTNLMAQAKNTEGRRGSTTFGSSAKGTWDTHAPEFSFKGNNKQSDGTSDAPTQETLFNEQNQMDSMEIDVRRRRKNLETAEERRQFVENYTKKLKTELCKNWELKGTCRYGDTCSFAHGRHQLRPKIDLPAKYKTKPCQQYHSTGFCYYGYRCHYLHDKDEHPEKTLEARSRAITAAMAAIMSEKCEVDGIHFQKSRRLGVFERFAATEDCESLMQ